jgi:hypothetical protein
MRQDKEQCNNCRFYWRGATECRRHAPGNFPYETNDSMGWDTIRMLGRWPRTGPTDWCGDYTPEDPR